MRVWISKRQNGTLPHQPWCGLRSRRCGRNMTVMGEKERRLNVDASISCWRGRRCETSAGLGALESVRLRESKTLPRETLHGAFEKAAQTGVCSLQRGPSRRREVS